MRAADPISPAATWRVTSYVSVAIDTNEVSHPFGDKPIGYIQYSPGGHVVVFIERGDTDTSVNPIYSDADRVTFFHYIFCAYADRSSVALAIVTYSQEMAPDSSCAFLEADTQVPLHCFFHVLLRPYRSDRNNCAFYLC